MTTADEQLQRAQQLFEIAANSASIIWQILNSSEPECSTTYSIKYTTREGTYSAQVVVRGLDLSLWTGKNGADLFAFLDAQCPMTLGPKLRSWMTQGEA